MELRRKDLREHVRIWAGRADQPTAAIIDSQSVKTTSTGGPRGYDGGKKVSDRKRDLLVDTLGLVLHLKLHPAHIGAGSWFRGNLPSFYPQTEQDGAGRFRRSSKQPALNRWLRERCTTWARTR